MGVGGIAQPHDLRGVEVKVARDFVGAATNEGFVEHDAERVNVDASVHLVGRQFELLRGHVRGRADHAAGARCGAGRHLLGFRNAEVEDLGDLVIVVADEENVRGLEVTMNHPGFMSLRHRPRDVRHDPSRLLRAKRSNALEPLSEALAIEQLHRDEGRALVDAIIDDLDNVRTAQRRRRLGFPLEADEDFRVVGEGLVDQLDGHGRAEREVHRLPDGPHATRTERCRDPKPLRDDASNHRSPRPRLFPAVTGQVNHPT